MTVSALMWLVGGTLVLMGSMGLTRPDVAPWLASAVSLGGLLGFAAASYTTPRILGRERRRMPLLLALFLVVLATIRGAAGGREWLVPWTFGVALLYVALAVVASRDTRERRDQPPDEPFPEAGTIPKVGATMGAAAALAMAVVVLVGASVNGIFLGAPGTVAVGVVAAVVVGAASGWLYTEMMYPHRSAMTHLVTGVFYGVLLWGVASFLVMEVVAPGLLGRLGAMPGIWFMAFVLFGAMHGWLPSIRQWLRPAAPAPRLRIARA